MLDRLKRRFSRNPEPRPPARPDPVTIPPGMVRCVHCQQPHPLADLIRVENEYGRLMYRTCLACAEIHELADDPQARFIGQVVPVGDVRIIQTPRKLPA